MYLGQKVCISGTDAQDFQANLAPFASSKDARRGLVRRGRSAADLEAQEPLFWPLVRIITLRCNAPALADGAILLDLPGVYYTSCVAPPTRSHLYQARGTAIAQEFRSLRNG